MWGRSMAKKKKSEQQELTVNFRWRRHEIEFSNILRKRADEADQIPGDFARELLKKTLQDSDVHSNQKHIRSMARTLRLVRTIREDLATLAYILLPHAGKWTDEQARRWVEEVFQKSD